jgi:hypothetical protein
LFWQTRQLERWGFQHVAYDDSPNYEAWYNETFIRGHKDELKNITMVDINRTPKVISRQPSRSSPSFVIQNTKAPSDHIHPVSKQVLKSIGTEIRIQVHGSSSHQVFTKSPTTSTPHVLMSNEYAQSESLVLLPPPFKACDDPSPTHKSEDYKDIFQCSTRIYKMDGNLQDVDLLSILSWEEYTSYSDAFVTDDDKDDMHIFERDEDKVHEMAMHQD